MCEFTGWKERGKEEGSYLLRWAHRKEKKKKVVKGSAVKVHMDNFWSIQTICTNLTTSFFTINPPPQKNNKSRFGGLSINTGFFFSITIPFKTHFFSFSLEHDAVSQFLPTPHPTHTQIHYDDRHNLDTPSSP